MEINLETNKALEKKGKVSVRHYLNTKVKETKNGYPLYIQVIHKRKTNHFRSLLNYFCKLENFAQFQIDNESFLDLEKSFISERIYLLTDGDAEGYSLHHYTNYSFSLVSLIRQYLKNMIFASIAAYENNKEYTFWEFNTILKNVSEFLSADKPNYNKFMNQGSIIPVINWQINDEIYLLKFLSKQYTDNWKLQELKGTFVREVDYYNLLAPEVLGTDITLGGWICGFASHLMLLKYKNSNYEHWCSHYFTAFDELLGLHGFNRLDIL